MHAHHDLSRERKEPRLGWARLQARLQRWRVTLSSLFAVVTLVLAEPTVQLILIGGSIALLGAGLRAWAAGHLRKDQTLTTGGPYAYTRNPLYLGSFLLGSGVVTASGNLVLLALFPILFFLIFSSAMAREALHLRKLFPEQYPPYRATIPAFFPRFTPYPAAARTRFSVRVYASHREYRIIPVLLLVFAILFAKAMLGVARSSSAPAQSDRPAIAHRLIEPLPFAEGEILEYEAHISKLLISGKIGTLSFAFGRATEPPLTGDHLITATAVSGGVWPRILGIKVRDVFESFVDPADFAVARTRKRYRHGRKRWFELSVFDRTAGTVVFIKRDLTRADAQPEVTTESSRSWVQDVVSSTYFLRASPLTVGETIEFPLADAARTISVRVNVLGRQRIKTGLGEFDTLKLQPLIFGGEDTLIRRDGELYVWMTEDRRRLPVKAVTKGNFGTVTIELKSIRGLGD